MKSKQATIDSIKIKVDYDENPDTSYIGEYTDDPAPGVIVRCEGEYLEKLGVQIRDTDGRFMGKDYELPARGREYRFFKPYAGGEKVGTANYYKYGLQDYKRMEGLTSGDWNYIGIQAEAVVKYPIESGSYRLETLTSGGLWGIESDSGDDYIKTVIGEELSSLKEHLKVFNVSLKRFDEMAAEAADEVFTEYNFR